MGEFWIGVAETLLGIFSFAGLIAFLEWRRTTKRLRKCVTDYVESGELEWQNQTDEFALMHRVRAFELLLRKVEVLQPRTPSAYKRVEEVRDAVEFFHRGGIPILNGEHLPLATIGAFPITPSDAAEALVRKYVLERLRAIKWLEVNEPDEQR